ncbi:MAG: DUF4445 domain-containing protein, partial [Desulfovibrio sp.]|nr:DUF4445 domain-containing protein [Desulfovibrio sp.]
CKQSLNSKELSACLLGGSLNLELGRAYWPKAKEKAMVEDLGRDFAPKSLGLALDLGTTNICYAVVALKGDKSGKILKTGQFLNPQAGAGSDVISRLALAQKPAGLQALSLVVRNEIKSRLLRDNPELFQSICLAANPAMLEIFLEREVRGLAMAPYFLSHLGHEVVHLPNWPPIYVPPLCGPYLGSDISLGLLALSKEQLDPPFFLADLGTNAEFLLKTKEGELYLASVPMGPAVEGIGMRCGKMAGAGVLTSFELTPKGLVGLAQGESCAKATGISATGYFSLLALLRKHGLLTSAGHLVQHPPLPLWHSLWAKLKQQNGRRLLPLPEGVFLDAHDLEEMLKVVAAFKVTFNFLLQHAGLKSWELKQVFFSGALGSYLAPSDLEEIGLLPRGLASKTKALGNTALQGAVKLLLDPKLATELKKTISKAEVLNVTSEPTFQDDFVSAMHF